MNKLTGKVAVVTGASKGIGASIAEHLAAEGASVVVNYASSKAGAEAVVKRIHENGGTALAVQADVSKPDEIKRLFADTKLPTENSMYWSTTPAFMSLRRSSPLPWRAFTNSSTSMCSACFLLRKRQLSSSARQAVRLST